MNGARTVFYVVFSVYRAFSAHNRQFTMVKVLGHLRDLEVEGAADTELPAFCSVMVRCVLILCMPSLSTTHSM